MTTTATAIQHAPWCNDHVDPNPQEGTAGWCAGKSITHDVQIELLTDVDSLDGGVGIEIYSPGDNFLTAARAREVAGALLKAADLIEEEALIASGRPTLAEVRQMTMDEVQLYAASRGCSASTVLRVVERER